MEGSDEYDRLFQDIDEINAQDALYYAQQEQEDHNLPNLFTSPELDDLLTSLGYMDGGASEPVYVRASNPVETEHHPKLDLTEFRTTFSIDHNMPSNMTELLTLAQHIDQQFDSVIRPFVDQAADNDKVTVRVSHPSLTKGDLYVYGFKDKFETLALTNTIAKLVQSNAEFIASGKFALSVGIVKNSSGGARTGAAQLVSANRKASTSLIEIFNDGVDCGHLAMYIADFRIRKDWRSTDQTEWKRIYKSISRHETPTYIRGLCSIRLDLINAKLSALSQSLKRDITIADLSNNPPDGITAGSKITATSLSFLPDKQLDLTGLAVYAWYLDVQIIVFAVSENQSRGEAQLHFHTNTTKPREQVIFLELLQKSNGENHFNVITNIAGYLGGRNGKQFCYVCYSAVDKLKNHRCRTGCPGCNSPDTCVEEEDEVRCPECSKKCRSESCLQIHQNRNTCEKSYQCPKCEVYLCEKQKKKHRCLHYVCQTCNAEHQEKPHYCCMKVIPIDPEKESENVVVVAFDIESKFVEKFGTIYHEPDLLCALITCDKCYDGDKTLEKGADNRYLPLKEGQCDICLAYRKEFIGKGCVKDFADYLYNDLSPHVDKADKKAVIRVFAHNFSGYDGRFLLRDLFNRSFEKPQVIMQGSKICSSTIANIRLQDSLKIFQCALSKLPKSFGFEDRVLKGRFPYLFNTPENEGYKGPMPDLCYFGYDDQKPEDQASLRAYHDSVKDNFFDLEKEKLDYCRDDVEILLIAIQKFRETFKEITGFDPIRPYFTLPSMAFGGFRRQFLQQNTIGITPTEGYGKYRNSSKSAHAYLDLIERGIGRTLRREQKLGWAWADGYDPVTHTVYEYLGCRWHGCLRCYPFERDRKVPKMKLTFNQAHKKYEEKAEYYKRLKCVDPELKVVETWECLYRTELRYNPLKRHVFEERMRYYDTLERVGGCDLRESYFGGRTNNRKFFHTCTTDDEWFEYVDFTSLYPAVCAKFPYMKGHPRVIRDRFEEYVSATRFKKEVFGFMKCKVYPPTNLQFPILPARIHDRLEFVLCMTCATEKARTTCSHTQEQRSITGTFATPELEEALANGYTIARVYEILHWEDKDCDLFKPFVFQWLKIKQESSGYPSWVQTDEDKQKYVDDYETRQGVKLDPENIKHDAIKREMAKRQLNSFYGKFAQRPNMEQYELVKTKDRLWELITNPRINVTGHTTVSENHIFMNWQYVNDEDAKQGNVNVAIASFITSYARRELWRAINEIETREPGCVFYFDTDSIIYKARTGLELLKTGDLLGELTSEVGRGEKIIQLVCLGPKNYAYVIRRADGTLKVVIKVKGITLNARALDILTVQKLTEIAQQYCLHPDEEQIELKIHQTRIGADPKHQLVMQQEMWKVYRAVSEKRVVIGNDTIPFGWVSNPQTQDDCIDAFISFLQQ